MNDDKILYILKRIDKNMKNFVEIVGVYDSYGELLDTEIKLVQEENNNSIDYEYEELILNKTYDH